MPQSKGASFPFVGFGLAIPGERPRRDAPGPSGSARNVQPVLLAG